MNWNKALGMIRSFALSAPLSAAAAAPVSYYYVLEAGAS